MLDERIRKLAKILVNYSTEVNGTDVVKIVASDDSKPLFLEVYREVIAKSPKEIRTRVDFEEMSEIFLKTATDEQLKKFPSIEMYEAQKADVYIFLGGTSNTRALSNIEPSKLSARSKVLAPISNEITEKKRWVLTRYPTNAQAQEADMSLEEFEDFVYNACLIDWAEESKKQDKIKEIFDNGKIVKLIGKETHLTFSIEGRLGTKCDGKRNMPDGEVYYAPVENSANGKIFYTYPAIYQGREVDGVILDFKDGKVVHSTATKNPEFLETMLNTDEGARGIGEFGIGTNFGIKKFVKNILFDEKIGGTIHLALGKAYEQSGGKNKSAIHWDMIKDLRENGEIYLDEKLVQKNGLWIF